MTEAQAKLLTNAALTMRRAASEYAHASAYRDADPERYLAALAFYRQAIQDIEAMRSACFGKSKSVH